MRDKILSQVPHEQGLQFRLMESLQACYIESVKIARKFYGSRIPIFTRKPSDTLSPEEKMMTILFKNESDIAQSLVNYQTRFGSVLFNNNIPVHYIILPNVEVITAFYIPEHVRWIKLMNYGAYPPLVDKWSGTFTYQDLSDLLEESKSIPKTMDFEQKFEDETFYTQESELIIDGIKYIRVIPIQPFLPVRECSNSDLRIVTSEECTIYIEMAMTKSKVLGDKRPSWILWSDKLKILECYGGKLGSTFI